MAWFPGAWLGIYAAGVVNLFLWILALQQVIMARYRRRVLANRETLLRAAALSLEEDGEEAEKAYFDAFQTFDTTNTHHISSDEMVMLLQALLPKLKKARIRKMMKEQMDFPPEGLDRRAFNLFVGSLSAWIDEMRAKQRPELQVENDSFVTTHSIVTPLKGSKKLRKPSLGVPGLALKRQTGCHDSMMLPSLPSSLMESSKARHNSLSERIASFCPAAVQSKRHNSLSERVVSFCPAAKRLSTPRRPSMAMEPRGVGRRISLLAGHGVSLKAHPENQQPSVELVGVGASSDGGSSSSCRSHQPSDFSSLILDSSPGSTFTSMSSMESCVSPLPRKELVTPPTCSVRASHLATSGLSRLDRLSIGHSAAHGGRMSAGSEQQSNNGLFTRLTKKASSKHWAPQLSDIESLALDSAKSPISGKSPPKMEPRF